jgi:hypothetical protein
VVEGIYVFLMEEILLSLPQKTEKLLVIFFLSQKIRKELFGLEALMAYGSMTVQP